MQTKSKLELTNIILSFGSKTVLSGVSHNFAVNKLTAVLGKSGSGKTSLLQILNGMLRPDSGLISLFGRPIDYDGIHSIRLSIGYVVQQVGLFPHLTVQSNINLLGRVSKMSKAAIHSRVQQLIEMVQLPLTSLKKFPSQLSGGEQQRVGLCRALFLNPPVLLMDEPFASLDRETKESIYNHILEIQQIEPRTIVLVTHDWEEALTLADSFVWIKDGTIRKSGEKTELEILKSTYLSDV